jgi:lipoprotein NlpD
MKRPIRMTMLCSVAVLALSACNGMDIDLRRADNGFTTANAARAVTAQRPRPDANGIITYPDYQVAVARRGDTVESVARRIGMDPAELARHNALAPSTNLRPGEVLALPRRVGAAATSGLTPPSAGGQIEVSTLADTAISRAEGSVTPVAAPAPVVQPAGMQPAQHRVERGETAFTIARLYNVTPQALAQWNGLDPEMRVREGQMLMIPVAERQAAATPSVAPAPVAAAAPAAPVPRPADPVTQPGTGSPTPVPPSASTPMPPPAASAQQQQQAATDARPASPDLGADRSAATRPRFVMPVEGRIIRAYAPGRNEGIGIASSPGTAVRAAAAGTVAAITEDTNRVPVVVIRHDGGLLTVYAQLEGLTMSRGSTVTQGQTIGRVRAGDPSFLHFEVRDGMNSVDPMRFLQ